MRHLLLPERTAPGESVQLDRNNAHYLTHVLRLGVGDTVDAVDPDGRRLVLRITRAGGNSVTATAESEHERAPVAPGIPITLYQAVPKGRRFDDVVRQTVQAGVTRIVPIITERTVVKPGADSDARLARWSRVAREAVQQSGGLPVELAPPVDLQELSPDPDALSLLLHEQPLAQATLHGYLDRVPRAIELVVGPEGGLSPREVELLSSRGFMPLWLGDRVLRSETAGIFVLGAIHVVIKERAAWQASH
jgi:16S rRNA (uracil1498-N3)-methyltransferase